MAKSSVGIVLRSKSVEVFEAHRGGRGLQVKQVASEAIPESDHPDVAQAIRSAFSRAGVSATSVGVSVASQDVLLRFFTLPQLPPAERESAVQFEVRKYLPFKISELVWSFHAVEQPSSKDLAIVFVGIRAEAFRRIAEWLKQAGVSPAWIEAHWVSLSRLAPEIPKASEHEFVGLVDVEPHVAHIVIAKDRAPYLARDVSLNVTRESLASGLAAIDPRAELLLSELRLSIDFFKREYPAAAVSQVMLFGDQAVIEPWCGYFASHLPSPVIMGRLPVELSHEQSANLQLACGAGLMMRQAHPQAPRLGFQEPLSAQAGARTWVAQWPQLAQMLSQLRLVGLLQSMARPLAVQGIAALVALIGVALFAHHQLVRKQQELTSITRTITEDPLGLKAKPHAELQTFQEDVTRRLAFLRQAIQHRVLVSEKLDALAKTLPDGMWLESITYQDRPDSLTAQRPTLTLQGACFLPQSPGGELRVISEFIQRIKQNPQFFRGFTMTQLGQIEIKQGADALKPYSYRTFALNCQSEQKL